MWVLLLKAHRIAGCLASLASTAVALGDAARHRVAGERTYARGPHGSRRRREPLVRSRFWCAMDPSLFDAHSPSPTLYP